MKIKDEKMKYIKEKVLVTGAAGFVGSHLCEALINDGYEVIALVHNKKEIGRLKNVQRLRAIKGDIENFIEIFKILKKNKPSGVFHLAAIQPSKLNNDPAAFFEANVGGTFNILDASRRLNIKKIIYSSSMSVYGSVYERKINNLPVGEDCPTDPYDFYSLTKLMGEEFCRFYARQFNLNIIVLRYSGIFGPRKKGGAVTGFIKNAFAGQPIKILNNINWDIIHVKDVVKANMAAFKKSAQMRFEIINIGSGQEINIKELAKSILEISGSKSKIELDKNLFLSKPLRFYYNITKAKKLLKFKPMSAKQGVRQYIKEINNNFKK
ncbi:MAG: NAD-dependent epimerase/dehydratase family protein [bacterium]|nr:NAD-dependent epimerase/dehydratase family protein [bacterium]